MRKIEKMMMAAVNEGRNWKGQIPAERWYEVTAPNVCGYTFASCGTIAEAKNYINDRINNL